MRALLQLFLGLAAVLVAATSPAVANQPSERRLALVLGNGAYKHTPVLPNPVRDAEAVAKGLTSLGFEVIVGMDLDHSLMTRRIQDFARRLDQVDVALFYYAGHGMQVNGENYIVPVDAALKREADLEFETIKVEQVLRQMQRASGPKIVMLDACRDNPLATQLSRQLGGRTRAVELSSGMREISVQNVSGTMIAFATAPGSVALDGDEANSPFTAALIKHMDTPGLDIDLMMKRVRGEVAERTNQRQQPWTNSSLTREFYLRPLPKVSEPPPAQAGMAVAALNATAAPALAQPALSPQSDILAQVELERWRTAERLGKREDYEEYLKHHPSGSFAETAGRRLAALGQKPADGRSLVPPQPERKPIAKAEPAVREARATQGIEVDMKLGRDDWRDVQRRLGLAGFVGPVTGNPGGNTRDALRDWQREMVGLETPTGFLNPEQRAYLIESTREIHAEWTEKGRPNIGAFVAGAAGAAAGVAAVRAVSREPVRQRQRAAQRAPRGPTPYRRGPANNNNNNALGAIIGGAALIGGAAILGGALRRR